jgi:hypothetical protein
VSSRARKSRARKGRPCPRKCRNLRADPRIALVGWEGEVTLQIQGVADEPAGAERERIQRIYFASFPDGRLRAAWPGITWFRVRPSWLRLSDFRTDPPGVTTWGAGQGGPPGDGVVAPVGSPA